MNKATSLLLRRLAALREDSIELRRRATIAAHVMPPCRERDLLREQLVIMTERDAVVWEKLVQYCAEHEDET